MSTPLSDEEFFLLLALPGRYTETGMDQSGNWRLDTGRGPVFVSLGRMPPPGVPADAFDQIRAPAAERSAAGRSRGCRAGRRSRP